MRAWWVIATAMLLAAVAAACGPEGGSGSGQVEASVTVRLDFAIDGLHAPFFVAEEKGFYEDLGLEVSIQPGQGSSDTVRVVGAGTAEFGVADAGTTLIGIAEDVPVTVAAVLLRSHPGVVVARQGSGIEQPDDLEGKSLGDAQESSTAALLPAFLKANGLEMSDIKFVGMTFPARVPALLNGQVDAIGGFIQEFVNIEDEAVFIQWAEHGIDAYSSSIIVNSDYLRDNEEVVRAFVQGSIRGLEYTLDNIEEAGQIVAEAAEGDVAYFTREIELLEPLYRGPSSEPEQLGLMTRERWEATQQLMLDYGRQSRELDLETVYTNAYLEGS